MANEIHITFMRHGRSRADDEDVHEGRYDSPLTDVGREQVRARAERWKHEGVTFDAVVSSTLLRAAESADIVGGALGVAVERDADWMERDNGPLAGLPPALASERYPSPGFSGPFDPYVRAANAGESEWDLHGRAARALQRVIRRGPGQYLVVAHGNILNATMRCIWGAAPTVGGQGVVYAFGDTAFVRATYYPEAHCWVITEVELGVSK